MGLSAEQIDVLLRPLMPHRVHKLNAGKPNEQSYLPAYDVAAHLMRVFGFGGGDQKILSLNLIYETESNGKWSVAYACTMRLEVKDPTGAVVGSWDNGAVDFAVNQPQRGEAHDQALKGAISGALKRCAAFGLGDQFGLSLYNKGSTAPLISKTVVGPEGLPEYRDLDSHIPEPDPDGAPFE